TGALAWLVRRRPGVAMAGALAGLVLALAWPSARASPPPPRALRVTFLDAVRKAESAVLARQTSKTYVAPAGNAGFNQSMEKLVFGETTTGPGNDIERATNIARTMVTQYGMSEKLGPRTFGRKEELVFLGREISEQRNYSEKIAEDIDAEVQQFITDAYQRAEEILTIHRGKLDRLAERLIAQETLEGQELEQIFRDLPAVGGKPKIAELSAAAPAAATTATEQPVAG
ncbi:MAG: hypothetical protein AAB289_17010, partial [Chloroflexota bacterium]